MSSPALPERGLSTSGMARMRAARQGTRRAPYNAATMTDLAERGLSEEQKMMRESCRAFVDDFVTPFIRKNWQREWLMDPDARLPAEILEQADRIGVRTLAVPEEYGGVQLDAAAEVRSFAIIAEE